LRGLRVPIVIGVLFGILWIAGSGADAQTPKSKYPPQSPTVEPSVIPSETPSPSGQPSPTPSVEPSRGPEPSEPPEDIPFTGADLTRFVLIGAGLTIAGTGLVRVARKVRSSGA
jgi:cytoskeletal protein RodZ